jgi:hypothetical protein
MLYRKRKEDLAILSVRPGDLTVHRSHLYKGRKGGPAAVNADDSDISDQ